MAPSFELSGHIFFGGGGSFWDFFRASKKFFYLRLLKLTDRKNDKDRDTRKRKLIELFYINVLGKASDIDSEGPGGETG